MDKAALLKDLRKQVTALEDDLRGQTDSVEEFRADFEREYAAAKSAERTAAPYESWRDERVTQVAAAWVLATVFVRFCEDNHLIDEPYIAGPGERLADAEDRQAAFFRERPELNDRDWLIEGFRHLAKTHEAVAGVFDERHNALWEIEPSYEAATALLGFWRERGPDGEIIRDFTDEELDTRFLGDLYQDLSEHARKTYALLQTPEFVEEFILDLTLEPAVEEFGLEPEWKYKPSGWPGDEDVVRGLRCIDPACGSGHFLLGMFRRLLEKWRAAEPGTDEWELVRRSLESVHGCDKNPFAVGIARFRLLVAVLKACDERRLVAAPRFPINVAVGDSLLHGRDAGRDFDKLPGEGDDGHYLYRTEDVGEFAERVDLLGRGSYHVVVGNPPYITVKDKQENLNYRNVYFSCSGKYALSVPFAQRIFELALRAGGSERNGGFAGQITANSFMKRDFGKVLIESFFHGGEYRDPQTKKKRHFSGIELSHVVDASGSYIPGHGTPTVILVGRNQVAPQAKPIRAVLGIRGEPGQPENAAEGEVWKAITHQVHRSGSESAWVSVEDASRDRFAVYPWSTSGGSSGTLMEQLNGGRERLSTRIDGSIGVHVILGDDEVFTASKPTPVWRRVGASTRRFTTGYNVRDWSAQSRVVLWPYSSDESADRSLQEKELFWPFRSALRVGLAFGKTKEQRGMDWHEHTMLSWSRTKAELLIAFACVATHNNFRLSRCDRLHNRHAPVIKLSENATEEQYLELLALLNSSTSCFWMKQVSQAKGGTDNSSGGGNRWSPEAWIERYEFAGTKLQDFPLPPELPTRFGSELDYLAEEVARCKPSAVVSVENPTRAVLDESRVRHDALRGQMFALQEELDWVTYRLYGLAGNDEAQNVILGDFERAPELALGERAFEIVLARKVAAGEVETVWFERHGSTPITQIPDHWPEEYKEIVQARIDLIESRKEIALLERPEYKRRWAAELWDKEEKEALRAWLLDRCENQDLWHGLRDGFRAPRTQTVSQLADALRQDDKVRAIAELYATDHMGKKDATLSTVLADVIASEHVPYLAAMRYKEPGLGKRAQWERIWVLQREEDRTGERLDIAVPPKYASGDFLNHSYWSHRGKLDVPKERFISYPDASPDADPTLLLGWAGWDHKDQVQALVNVINDRTEQAGWSTSQLIPLIAGIQELMPWVHQWHGEHEEDWGGNPAEEYQAYLDTQRSKHGLSAEDLMTWRPEKKRRGRAKKAD